MNRERERERDHSPAPECVVGSKLQAGIRDDFNKCGCQSSIQPAKPTSFEYIEKCSPHVWIYLIVGTSSFQFLTKLSSTMLSTHAQK